MASHRPRQRDWWKKGPASDEGFCGYAATKRTEKAASLTTGLPWPNVLAPSTGRLAQRQTHGWQWRLSASVSVSVTSSVVQSMPTAPTAPTGADVPRCSRHSHIGSSPDACSPPAYIVCTYIRPAAYRTCGISPSSLPKRNPTRNFLIFLRPC
jgi:hypothetical protein